MTRSKWFLASALDARKSPLERTAAWGCAELEAWYEAVIYRQLRIESLEPIFRPKVRHLILERNETPWRAVP